MRFLLFAAAASAHVMSTLHAVPKGWHHVRHASPDDTVTLRIALRQQNPQVLEQAVLDMSTPGHPNYGMHMTRDELQSHAAPSPESQAAVKDWLTSNRIEARVRNDWVTLTTSTSKANALLNSSFSWYQYQNGGGPKLRTLSYSIPDHLVQYIDLVQPTTRFGQLGAQKSTIFEMHRVEDAQDISSATNAKFTANSQGVDESCAYRVTPNCLKSLYNINYTASAGPENKVAFASYLEEYARYEDFTKFQKEFVPKAVGQNFTVELVNGGLNDQHSVHDSAEANLDLQYIFGISHPIPIVEYSTAGRGPLVPTQDDQELPGFNEPYLEWLLYMLNLADEDLPQAVSTSYGEEEQSVPEEYARKVCNMMMQLGARGVSVLFASGDSGPGNSCVSNTNNQTYFNPTFPAGCPWVTAVGATTGVGPEKAATYSSGGFSIYHDQPAYQQAVVGQYLDKINGTYSQYFNRSGRAIPDVAAQGSNFAVFNKNYTMMLAGTSASCPVFTGIVALLNAARRTQGNPPLGFLNPWLYSIQDAFNDIKDGYGGGCWNNMELNRARWNATAGWDPVTGLGTPKFERLLELAAPGVDNS
ncbi:tripeptidyl-peptidase [Podospora conica]|nr:tripeptidyl-peptidase [Schizothecium conicum]